MGLMQMLNANTHFLVDLYLKVGLPKQLDLSEYIHYSSYLNRYFFETIGSATSIYEGVVLASDPNDLIEFHYEPHYVFSVYHINGPVCGDPYGNKIETFANTRVLTTTKH
jgi:hypothetical protein